MFDKIEYNMNYNKKHYVRVPLDMPIPEYNALKEHCRENGIAMNTLIRNLVQDIVPLEILEKHMNDTEKEK